MRKALQTAAVAALLLLTGCSVESSADALGPAYLAEPPVPLTSTVCAPLQGLPSGIPLEGLALGSKRETAVQDAIAGEAIDREELDAAYDAMLSASGEFAAAFESADDAYETDRANPINVAAQDWRGFHDAITEQRRSTQAILDLVVDLTRQGEEATLTEEYKEAARGWNDAQRKVDILSQQLPWSHHRAVVYVAESCGEVPDWPLDEIDS